MRDLAAKLGITPHVAFPGFVSRRKEILQTLADSDIFLFCHKTRESARVLGEALACGCALIGYDSAYPKELVARYGGGQFAPLGDWHELAQIVLDLNKNRGKLRELIRMATTSGQIYDRHEQLRHRVALIRGIHDPAAL